MVNNTKLDNVFGALANTSRRQIISSLRSRPHTMTELATPLHISLPAIHKHIVILEKAQLVSRTKVGRERQVVLRPTALSSADEWIAYHQANWNNQLDKLETYITRKKGEM